MLKSVLVNTMTNARSSISPESASRVNLLGLSADGLRAFLADIGEKPFRAQQILQWVHQKGVLDFEQMSNISKALRAKLAAVAELAPPEIASEHISADGTRKWAVRVSGGALVETVYIPDGGRATLCVSSQVGCSLDCSFCSTGKQGFQQDLTAAEIIGQVWLACNAMGDFGPNGRRSVTNVVLMGMGEPLLNFDNVMPACSLMMDDFAYGISKRRVTLSTSGVVPAMKKMLGVTDVSLAISLHAPNDELRNKLVPINRKYNIAALLDATAEYMASVPDVRRVVTIEYTLMAGINDADAHAEELAVLLRNTPCKINLIPFNPFELSDYQRPSRNRIERFQRILAGHGYIATVRTTRGDDIDAACGQLVGKVTDRTRRNERHLARAAAISHVAL